jgi:hypothetical protein
LPALRAPEACAPLLQKRFVVAVAESVRPLRAAGSCALLLAIAVVLRRGNPAGPCCVRCMRVPEWVVHLGVPARLQRRVVSQASHRRGISRAPRTAGAGRPCRLAIAAIATVPSPFAFPVIVAVDIGIRPCCGLAHDPTRCRLRGHLLPAVRLRGNCSVTAAQAICF